MAGNYNTTQKNLLVASDHAQQALRRLEYARNADDRRDVPQLRPRLAKIIEDQAAVTDSVHKLRQDYDDGDFDNEELPLVYHPTIILDKDLVRGTITEAREHEATLTSIFHKLEDVITPEMLEELRVINAWMSDLGNAQFSPLRELHATT